MQNIIYRIKLLNLQAARKYTRVAKKPGMKTVLIEISENFTCYTISWKVHHGTRKKQLL